MIKTKDKIKNQKIALKNMQHSTTAQKHRTFKDYQRLSEKKNHKISEPTHTKLIKHKIYAQPKQPIQSDPQKQTENLKKKLTYNPAKT